MAGKNRSSGESASPSGDQKSADPRADQTYEVRAKSGSIKKAIKLRVSKSHRAGLAFPVSRVLKSLRKGRYAKHIQVGASVYLTSVIEYLVAEILELSSNAATQNKKLRVTPRHLCLAIRHDEELNQLFAHVTIPNGGVVPFIHKALLPKKTAPKANANVAAGN